MRVMIFGAGRLAPATADVVRACGHSVTGFVDIDESLVGKEIEPGGGRVLMNDDEFFEMLEEGEDLEFDAIALAVTDNKVRLRLFFELSDESALPPFVHPSAVVSTHANVGAGSIVMPLVVINSMASVGRAAVIGAGAVIDSGASVGDAALLGANATICRDGSVGERVHVGEGATVSSGISVGADSMLGSSAVLTWNAGEGSNVVAPAAITKE